MNNSCEADRLSHLSEIYFSPLFLLFIWSLSALNYSILLVENAIFGKSEKLRCKSKKLRRSKPGDFWFIYIKKEAFVASFFMHSGFSDLQKL